MPVPGGTTPKLANAFCPHLRNSYRSRFRSNSLSVFSSSAAADPYSSTCTLWSITRSTGTSGLIRWGSPPARFIADRMAARSTTHGTPVKSCKITRAGENGSSTAFTLVAFQFATPVHVRLVHHEPVQISQRALQQHLDRERQLVQVPDPQLGQPVQPEQPDVAGQGGKGRLGTERVLGWHGVVAILFARPTRLNTARRRRCGPETSLNDARPPAQPLARPSHPTRQPAQTPNRPHSREANKLRFVSHSRNRLHQQNLRPHTSRP